MEKRRYNILIVDDEPVTRDMLTTLLSSNGYKCDVAFNGKQALAKMDSKEYSAVITDVVMPDMDGISLTREISKKYPLMPVMVMTGYIGEYPPDEAIKAGASDFINKPFTTEEFIVRFNRMMRDQEIMHLAIKDPLTNIYNRRHFNEELRKEIDRAARYERKLSVIILDIDHFKNVNDTFGHQTGDYVLRELAMLIGKHIRKTDIFARYGGEEFCILMPETDITGATEFADKIRSIIERHPFKDVKQIMASFGVSEYKKGDDSFSLIKRTDDALYIAKSKGRNRVERL